MTGLPGFDDGTSAVPHDPIAEAAQEIFEQHTIPTEVDDRTILLTEPVKVEPPFAVLRALGLAQAASPVGAAAQGSGAVAAGVWRRPDLFLARWSGGRRWVSGYRITGPASLTDHVRMEGRIPTRFETGNWYGAVPAEVEEAFLEVGMLVDDPPFPVPAPPPPPAEPAPPARRARGAAGRSPRASAGRPGAGGGSAARPGAGGSAARPGAGGGSAGRPGAGGSAARPGAGGGSAGRPVGSGPQGSRAPAPTPRPKPAVAADRLCGGCNMRKPLSQFVAGSDFCVDCR